MVAVSSWKALGTSVHVLTTNADDLAGAELAVRETVRDVDEACSRFRPDSELSRLNTSGGTRVTVSPLLARALGVALQAARRTDGALDPTIGSAIRLAGYDNDFTRVAATGAALRLRAETVPGWRMLQFDSTSRRLAVPRGVELDLGSTGKALAADLAASAALASMRDGGVLVSLGGDISTAGTAPAGGWRVLVAEDSSLSPDSEGQVLCIHDGAIATSSTTVRRWSRGQRTLHHIIDPATGLPAAVPWRTVTVLADNCVDANTAATAAIVRGEEAIDWLKSQRLPARLVENDGTIHFLGPWPDPNWIVA